VEGSCEHGNEPSVSIKCWEVLEWLHNWRLLKKGSAAWESDNRALLQKQTRTQLTEELPAFQKSWRFITMPNYCPLIFPVVSLMNSVRTLKPSVFYVYFNPHIYSLLSDIVVSSLLIFSAKILYAFLVYPIRDTMMRPLIPLHLNTKCEECNLLISSVWKSLIFHFIYSLFK
jgi:hypothetical protein